MTTITEAVRWVKENNPGLVTKQHYPEDRNENMEVLESMMEQESFWMFSEDGEWIPSEEHWEKVEELGFSDPDFIVLSWDEHSNGFSFEIR